MADLTDAVTSDNYNKAPDATSIPTAPTALIIYPITHLMYCALPMKALEFSKPKNRSRRLESKPKSDQFTWGVLQLGSWINKTVFWLTSIQKQHLCRAPWFSLSTAHRRLRRMDQLLTTSLLKLFWTHPLQLPSVLKRTSLCWFSHFTLNFKTTRLISAMRQGLEELTHWTEAILVKNYWTTRDLRWL